MSELFETIRDEMTGQFEGTMWPTLEVALKAEGYDADARSLIKQVCQNLLPGFGAACTVQGYNQGVALSLYAAQAVQKAFGEAGNAKGFKTVGIVIEALEELRDLKDFEKPKGEAIAA